MLHSAFVSLIESMGLRKRAILLFLLLLVCVTPSLAIKNPAAVYCAELGYKYGIEETEEGQVGRCFVTDNLSFNAWDFFTGKVGKEYSYCAKQGYETVTLTDGKNPYSPTYGACVVPAEARPEGPVLGDMKSRVVSLVDMMGIREKVQEEVVIPKLYLSEPVSKPPLVKGDSKPLPSEFSWGNYKGQNWVGKTKDQGNCGSCWAFAAVGAVEAKKRIEQNNPKLNIDLSEMHLVSDCFPQGDCNGGHSHEALRFIMEEGIVDEKCFPYFSIQDYLQMFISQLFNKGRVVIPVEKRSCDAKCKDWQTRLTHIDGFEVLEYMGRLNPAREDIKRALIEKGPLVASVLVDGGFDLDGIYYCGKPQQYDFILEYIEEIMKKIGLAEDDGCVGDICKFGRHSVLIVGYKDVPESKEGGYWIIKNSWGILGDLVSGFIIGYGECGIEDELIIAISGQGGTAMLPSGPKSATSLSILSPSTPPIIFLREFSPLVHVYDYGNLLEQPLEQKLQALKGSGIGLYVATFSKDSELDIVRNNFRWEDYIEGFVDEAPRDYSEIPSTQKRRGSILSFEDAVAYDDASKNVFKLTGRDLCWPKRQPSEPDWIEIWKEHYFVDPPEGNERRIQIKPEWVGADFEGRFEVSVEGNVLLGAVFKDTRRGYWLFFDREGNEYKLAPLDFSHPIYSQIPTKYPTPEAYISSVLESTLTVLLWEKYGKYERVKGGREGYPLPECNSANPGSPNPLVAPRDGTGVNLGTSNSCRALLLISTEGKISFGEQGCGIDPERIIQGIRLKRNMSSGELSRLVLEIAERIKGSLFPSDTPTSCEGMFERVNSLLSTGGFNEATRLLQEIEDKCGGMLRLRAMYQYAELLHSRQDYIKAAGVAETVFLDADVIENTRPLAMPALGLAIRSSRSAGDCSAVTRLHKIWVLKGYARDEGVERALAACTSPPPTDSPSEPTDLKQAPFRADLLRTYNLSLKHFERGDYERACLYPGGLTPGAYLAALPLDRELARQMLSLLIRCHKGRGDCTTAEAYLQIYSREFGKSQELETELRNCVDYNVRWLSFSPVWNFQGYEEPKGEVEAVVSQLAAYGWEMYQRGEFKNSCDMADYAINKYFPPASPNAAIYPTQYKSLNKLKILCRLALAGQSADCTKIGTLLYTYDYRKIWGVDEDIESAWNKCEGKSHKKVVENCTSSWPTGEGGKVGFNSVSDSCELFSTAHPLIERALRDAKACCSLGLDESALCRFARENSNLPDKTMGEKRCMGIYIIKGVGEYAKYISGYFEPEINCAGAGEAPHKNPYRGSCNSTDIQTFSQNARMLPCRNNNLVVWGSDTDMSQNNCFLVEPPAYTTLDILKTGTCGDYSALVTTMLRKAGYSPTEVFSVSHGGHATNLVRLPGEAKYHHVDTTGNKVGIVFNGVFPSTDYNAIGRLGCYNDLGWFRCPDNSMIIESFEGN